MNKSTRQKMPAARLALSVCMPLFAAAMGLTSNIANAQPLSERDTQTQCLAQYKAVRGTVAVGVYFDPECDTQFYGEYRANAGDANAVYTQPEYIRDDNQIPYNGNRVCMNFTPDLTRLVVTATHFDPKCGDNPDFRGARNSADIYAPVEGMIACLGYPIPKGYEIGEKLRHYTACGYNRFFFDSANITQYNAGILVKKQEELGIPLISTGWMQILDSTTYKQYYNGPGNRFVVLPAGRYDVINHSDGWREPNVEARPRPLPRN